MTNTKKGFWFRAGNLECCRQKGRCAVLMACKDKQPVFAGTFFNTFQKHASILILLIYAKVELKRHRQRQWLPPSPCTMAVMVSVELAAVTLAHRSVCTAQFQSCTYLSNGSCKTLTQPLTLQRKCGEIMKI